LALKGLSANVEYTLHEDDVTCTGKIIKNGLRGENFLQNGIFHFVLSQSSVR